MARLAEGTRSTLRARRESRLLQSRPRTRPPLRRLLQLHRRNRLPVPQIKPRPRNRRRSPRQVLQHLEFRPAPSAPPATATPDATRRLSESSAATSIQWMTRSCKASMLGPKNIILSRQNPNTQEIQDLLTQPLLPVQNRPSKDEKIIHGQLTWVESS